MSQWISLEAFGWLQDSQSRQAANEESENRWWRRKWAEGDAMPIGSTSEPEEMRQTILGDITHPAPIIMPQQQQSNLLPTLAMAAVAGVGGYLVANRDEPKSQPIQQAPPAEFNDETISVGLGKIEDYQTQGSRE